MLRFSKTAVVTLLLSNALFAQFGRFSIAEEPTGPRIASMGSAGTALAGGGFGCYNPASPAFAAMPFLTVEYGGQPDNLSKSLIETAWMFRKWFAGASLRVHTTDYIVTTEQSAGPEGPVSSNQVLQAAIAGGYICGRLAAGSSLVFFQERIGDQTFHALTWSPGVLFQLVPNSLTVGASLQHYLRLDTAGKKWYKTPAAWYQTAKGLPRYARAGIAWNDTLRRWTLPYTAACDVVYSDVYERFMVPVGAEVWLLPSIAVRAGLRLNHPTERAHFGIGLRWSSLAFDFDYGIAQLVSGADLETKWLFGLTYSLNAKKQETAPRRTVSEPMPIPPPAQRDSTVLPIVPGTPPAASDSANAPSVKPDTTGSVRPDSLQNVPARTVPEEDSVSSKK
jgi:hypothetical protein